ncbi:MAG: hypothetical protein U0821_15200 [Chloroflexota bacterium]
MPLPIPNLDDRRFEDLVREATGLIPTLTPEWTNFNTSDPGITLLELFAFLAESQMFQANQLSDPVLEQVVTLLGGSTRPDDSSVRAGLSRLVASLESPTRAVTTGDHEAIALAAGAALSPHIARAACVATDLGVTVVIVPADRSTPTPKPAAQAIQTVFRALDERRLIGEPVAVRGPRYVGLDIDGSVALRTDGNGANAISDALIRFLHPLDGGEHGGGWPFGHAVYRSELLQLLEGLPAVDYVEALAVSARPGSAGQTLDHGVVIPTDALVSVTRQNVRIRISR